MHKTEDAYYHSRLYQEFKGIEVNEYRNIVRFFENRSSEIRALPLNEYLELSLSYANALFEMGTYHSYLSVADHILELTIDNNIKYFHGEDIFSAVLFKKAAAHFNLLEYEKSTHILRELVKMNCKDKHSIQFLKKSIRYTKPDYLKSTRAISVFLFLLTAAIIAVELCIIRPFGMEYLALTEWIRNALFISGWLVLISGDLFHRWSVNRSVNLFVKNIKETKKSLQKA